MGPKVTAALAFLAGGGSRVIITSARLLADAVAGGEGAGTSIVLEDPSDGGSVSDAQSVRVFPGAYLDSLLLMSATVTMEEQRRRRLGRGGHGDASWARRPGRRAASRRPSSTAWVPTTSCSRSAARTRTASPPPWRRGGERIRRARAGGRRSRGAGADEHPRCGPAAAGHRRRHRVGARGVRGARGAPRAHRRPARAAVQRRRPAGGGGRAQGPRASELGLLVMGPGRGHGGDRRNRPRVRQRAVGAREPGPRSVSSRPPAPGRRRSSALLDRWGVHVSQVIGVGGATSPRRWTARWPASPHAPSPPTRGPGPSCSSPSRRRRERQPGCSSSAGTLLPSPSSSGWTSCRGSPAAHLEPTLERAAAAGARLVGATPPSLVAGLRDAVATATARLPASRTLVRGLFSGGTLCYEAQLVLGRLLGPVVLQRAAAPGTGPAGARRCARAARPGRRGVHPGRGPPDDRPDRPARAAAPPGRRPRSRGGAARRRAGSRRPRRPRGPSSRRSAPSSWPAAARRSSRTCSGPRSDPQVYSRQRAVLEEAGCIVPQTNARAAYAAAALALRRPELAEEGA